MQENNSYISIEKSESQYTIKFLEPVTLTNGHIFDKSIDIAKTFSDADKITIDCSSVREYDSFFVVLANSFSDYCSDNNIKFEITNMSNELESFYHILSRKGYEEIEEEKKSSAFAQWVIRIGKGGQEVFRDTYNFIEFFGIVISKLFKLITHPRSIRWKDFPLHFMNSGVQAVPITALIVYMIGITTGYQGAIQLKQFGADIYIADLVGISITRELSPLMVAILVAGRSGSAFAAEIGTMKVSEEIDALQSMGFDTTLFLVLPRVLAVTIAMPILTLFCNVVGIAGGLTAALTSLNITITGFFNELSITLTYYDVFTGLFKSMIFGFLIATTGCFRGFQVTGGAESVGKYTTASVVTGIFLIILIDAIFTFVFQAIGI